MQTNEGEVEEESCSKVEQEDFVMEGHGKTPPPGEESKQRIMYAYTSCVCLVPAEDRRDHQLPPKLELLAVVNNCVGAGN